MPNTSKKGAEDDLISKQIRLKFLNFRLAGETLAKSNLNPNAKEFTPRGLLHPYLSQERLEEMIEEDRRLVNQVLKTSLRDVFTAPKQFGCLGTKEFDVEAKIGSAELKGQKGSFNNLTEIVEVIENSSSDNHTVINHNDKQIENSEPKGLVENQTSLSNQKESATDQSSAQHENEHKVDCHEQSQHCNELFHVQNEQVHDQSKDMIRYAEPIHKEEFGQFQYDLNEGELLGINSHNKHKDAIKVCTMYRYFFNIIFSLGVGIDTVRLSDLWDYLIIKFREPE